MKLVDFLGRTEFLYEQLKHLQKLSEWKIPPLVYTTAVILAFALYGVYLAFVVFSQRSNAAWFALGAGCVGLLIGLLSLGYFGTDLNVARCFSGSNEGLAINIHTVSITISNVVMLLALEQPHDWPAGCEYEVDNAIQGRSRNSTTVWSLDTDLPLSGFKMLGSDCESTRQLSALLGQVTAYAVGYVFAVYCFTRVPVHFNVIREERQELNKLKHQEASTQQMFRNGTVSFKVAKAQNWSRRRWEDLQDLLVASTKEKTLYYFVFLILSCLACWYPLFRPILFLNIFNQGELK